MNDRLARVAIGWRARRFNMLSIVRLRRVAAFGVDWCCMLVWVALVAAVGVPLYLNGAIDVNSPIAQNLVGLIVIVPIVLGVAWCESRPRAATIGKRAFHLVVEHNGARPTFARALLRNALKLGLPWGIAHAAVFAVVDTSTNGHTATWAIALLIGSYVLPLVWLVTLMLPGAKPLYDHLSATRVIRAGDAAAR